MHFVHLCTPMMSLAWKWCYLVVGHILTYILFQIWSKLDWQFLRYKHFCILPLFSQIWPLSDHPASETWLQNQLHNNSSPSLPRPQLMPLLVCWQLGQYPSACPSMTGTPKTPITPPYFGVPWRTGFSSTTSCWTVRTISDMSLLPWEPNPWRCMHKGCLPAVKRNRQQPR